MKKYTFTLNEINNATNNKFVKNSIYGNIGTKLYYTIPSTNNYKTIDDLIDADIIDKNPWLYGYKTPKNTIKIKVKPYTSEEFIFGDENIKLNYAFNFLANLPKYCPFKKNVTYKLSNGDIIEITDDYIHINQTMYFFNLMDEAFFYNLSSSMKKTIATIYVDGLKITIKK